MKTLANTLLCKMEPSKVRVQELTLVYYAVRSLVHMEGIEEPADDAWPNLGAIFAEHLTKLKRKPFQSTGRKRETVGSLLTPIFVDCGVPLDDAEMDDRNLYMDSAHLTRTMAQGRPRLVLQSWGRHTFGEASSSVTYGLLPWP